MWKSRLGEERRILKEALDSGFSTYESIRHRKDGSLLYVDFSSKAIRDGKGNVEFVLSSKKDITPLKVLRDAKLVEARFRDLLESMPDGIVIVNASGHIVRVSRQAERLFGSEHGQLRGKPIEVLLPKRFHGAHVGRRAAYVAQHRVRTMGAGLELHGQRKDGTEFPVEISLSPLDTEEGMLVSSAIRDIMDRKRYEQALQDKNIELANANQAKDRFLAGMSHELRTPLNAIIGFKGTLLTRLPGSRGLGETVAYRPDKRQHLLALINDLPDCCARPERAAWSCSRGSNSMRAPSRCRWS